MEYVAIVLIAVSVAAFIAHPLFGRQRKLYHIEDALEAGETKQLNYLNLKKSRTEENLRELEFEYQMGKLSEQDYAALRKGYVNEVDEISKAIEKLKMREEIEELIEGEVRTRRHTK